MKELYANCRGDGGLYSVGSDNMLSLNITHENYYKYFAKIEVRVNKEYDENLNLVSKTTTLYDGNKILKTRKAIYQNNELIEETTYYGNI